MLNSHKNYISLSGKYRGAAHSHCNLNYRIHPEKIKIPCIAHNLKNYDSHLNFTSVKDRHGPISCIPTNTEKYISFSIGGATFIDSFQLMASSLDNLS